MDMAPPTEGTTGRTCDCNMGYTGNGEPNMCTGEIDLST